MTELDELSLLHFLILRLKVSRKLNCKLSCNSLNSWMKLLYICYASNIAVRTIKTSFLDFLQLVILNQSSKVLDSKQNWRPTLCCSTRTLLLFFLAFLNFCDPATLILMPSIEYWLIQTKTTEIHKPHKILRF